MKITIELDSKNELDKLSALFKTFKINTVEVISKETINIPVIKGDKKIDPSALFGIWSDAPRSIEGIRDKGWKRRSKTA